MELKILPPFGEACVCHPWSHRDAFAFAFVLQQGVQAAHPVLHQRRHWMCAGEINPGRRIDVPAWRETYLMDKLFQCCVLQ